MEKFLKKISNFLIFTLLFLSFLSPSFSYAQVQHLNTFDKVSISVYCFFASCGEEKVLVKKAENNNIKKNIVDKKPVVKNEKPIAKKTSPQKTKIKYIERVVKQKPTVIYTTVEKKPVINNITEVTETKIIEKEGDTSKLERKIRNNRNLISQLAGIDTSGDDLSDNSLNDLADTNISAPTNGQVLT